MHIVSHKAIRLFCEDRPGACHALDYWYRVARRADWASFVDVKKTFSAADLVAPYVVFDIGGNKFRLIAEINFSRRVLFIRHIMTHKDYERGAWKP
jgi:mRNA interferase HigB